MFRLKNKRTTSCLFLFGNTNLIFGFRCQLLQVVSHQLFLEIRPKCEFRYMSLETADSVSWYVADLIIWWCWGSLCEVALCTFPRRVGRVPPSSSPSGASSCGPLLQFSEGSFPLGLWPAASPLSLPARVGTMPTRERWFGEGNDSRHA